MKIQGWMVLAMLLLSGTAFGQNEPPRFREAMEKMKVERVSFLTEKLQLTVEEAEKFWPLYNEYLSGREEMMWGKRKNMRKDFDPAQLSDDEMNTMLNEVLDQDVRLAQFFRSGKF
jgi:hypothetical protein